MADILAFTPRSVTPAGDLEVLAVRFLGHLSARSYAANTLQAYRRDLERLVGFLAGLDIRLVQSVAPQHIDRWLEALVHGEGLSPRTAARALEAAKGLFRFAVRRDWLTEQANPMRHVEPPRWHARKVVAPEEGTLLRVIDGIPADTRLGLRDRALFRLMYAAGLRVTAIASLDLYDPDRPPRFTVLPSGRVTYLNKGGAEKETVADETAMERLAEWLPVRHAFERQDSPPALFLSSRGGRLTRAGIHQRLREYGERAGVPGLHCHLLRHRRIGEVMDRAGLPLAHYLSGHSRTSTTADTYGQQSQERLRMRLLRECPVGGARHA
ncbi:tyrosine-type recombinase/integrase [Thioalbus denitrificans]|uniref:Integrase/recombinase XerC n=1 Tax=Thioalbus denitrificans TaxID=547122 RepID=A0A369CG97_9GAMM|nr:tyrosine-type recombinase/integrase [Thioalbus denitrificans]RCX32105.1 integrase/recombinase XerC [Thioalbus denitrificans]